jgi:hypothetical protein
MDFAANLLILNRLGREVRYATIRLMAQRLLMALLLVLTGTLAHAQTTRSAGAEDRDPLTRARVLYNQRAFSAAIRAADQARLAPGRADSADLVAARAYLERYRESVASDDLADARERLRRLDPRRLAAAERTEFLVGLGEMLYFDEAFGAAADVFRSVIVRDDEVALEARDRVIDWWATALDSGARPRPEMERRAVYERIRARAETELAVHPSSGAAAYWLAAAARGEGDLQGAWDAVEAGWVRASLARDRGAELRADLDRLMLRAIVPERARVTAQPADALRLEWERFKERWLRPGD